MVGPIQEPLGNPVSSIGQSIINDEKTEKIEDAFLGVVYAIFTRTDDGNRSIQDQCQNKKGADKVINSIKRIMPVGKINFDLEDSDKILRIEAADIPVQPIVNLLLDLGFACVPLE